MANIKALRAGERQVWPGNGMELTAWAEMEPASVFRWKEAGREKTGGQNGVGSGQQNGMKRATLAARCNPAYELNELN